MNSTVDLKAMHNRDIPRSGGLTRWVNEIWPCKSVRNAWRNRCRSTPSADDLRWSGIPIPRPRPSDSWRSSPSFSRTPACSTTGSVTVRFRTAARTLRRTGTCSGRGCCRYWAFTSATRTSPRCAATASTRRFSGCVGSSARTPFGVRLYGERIVKITLG